MANGTPMLGNSPPTVARFQAAISFSRLPKIPHEHPPKQTLGAGRIEYARNSSRPAKVCKSHLTTCVALRYDPRNLYRFLMVATFASQKVLLHLN